MKYEINAPKEFWKYFDLFRRKKICLFEFSYLSGIPISEILLFLKCLSLEKKDGNDRK